MIAPLLTVTLLPAILFVAGRRFVPDWVSEIPVPWNRLLIIASATAVAFGAGMWALGASSLEMFATMLIAWLTPITAVADYATYKIPRGVSKVAYTLAFVPLLAFCVVNMNIAPLIVVGFLLVIPGALMFSSGIGFGDIRLLILFCIALPWWTGVQTFTHILLAAVLIQGLLFVLARIFDFGRLRDVPVGKVRRSLYRIVGKDYPVTMVAKRSLPFGPALMFAALLGAVMTAVFSNSVTTYAGGVDCLSIILCLA